MAWNRFSTTNAFEGETPPSNGSGRQPATVAQIHIAPYDSTGNYMLQGNTNYFIDLMLSKYGKTVTVHNWSQGGSNATAWNTPSNDYLEPALASAANHSNPIFLASLGTNGDGTSEAFESAFRSVIGKVQAAGHSIIVSNILSPRGQTVGDYGTKNDNYVNPMVLDLVPESYDTGLSRPHVDLRGISWGLGDTGFVDSVHPKPELARLMLQEWAETLNAFMDVTLTNSATSTKVAPTMLISGATQGNGGDTIPLSAVVADPDTGETITVHWSVDGSATLSAEKGNNVNLLLGGVTENETITVSAYADDGEQQSHIAALDIDIAVGNLAPVFTGSVGAETSNANTEQTVVFNFTDDVAVTRYEIAVAQSDVIFTTNENSITLNTGVSGIARDIDITCTAFDVDNLSDVGAHTIRVAALVNTKPVINSFTGPQTASAGTLSEYVVTASDSENDTLTFEYTVTSTGPNIALTENGDECSFTALQNASEYSVTISVRAFDGELYSDPVSITNVIEPEIEEPIPAPAPIVIITGPETVEAGKDVTLKAYVIGEPEQYTFNWSVEQGDVQTTSHGKELTFTAPIAQAANQIEIGVVASTSESISEKATFTVQVAAEPEKSTLRIKVAGLKIGLRDITLYALSNPLEPLFEGEVLVSKNRVTATVYAPKGTKLIGWHLGDDAPYTSTCIYGITE